MLFDICLMILEPSQLSSLKPFKEIFSKDLCAKIVDELNIYYSNPAYNRPKKYLLKGITQELQIGEAAKYNVLGYIEFKEKEFNYIISKRLSGKSIPKKGFHLSTVEIQMPYTRDVKVLDFDLDLPADKTNDSSLRVWKAEGDVGIPPHLQRTSMYSVPLKFLSSKIENDKSHPPRGDFWVYRIRFYITDKDKLKQSTINVYQNGYIGITSRTPFERFNEHYYGKTNKLPKSLYNCWSHIDERKVNHIVSFEILDRCNTQKEMEDLEKLYIDKYNTLKNGFNSVPGGDDGITFLKSLGIDCDDIENKDNYISKLPKGITNSKRPHLVREHMREYKTNTYCLVSEHYRNLPKEAEALLDT